LQKAEEAVLLEHYGRNYDTGVKALFDRKVTQEPDATKALMWRHARNTFLHQIGELDHPVNTRIAAIGSTVRAFANLVAGWLSGVSSLNDAAGLVSALRYAGVDPSGLHSASVSRIAHHYKNRPELQNVFAGMGAGLEAMIASANRMVGAEDSFGRKIRTAGSYVFKLNGQEDWGRMVQTAYADIMSQHLAEMSMLDELPSEFMNWLNANGISPAQFSEMGKYTQVYDELEGPRLFPNTIEDTELAAQLERAVRDNMDYAMFKPSVSVEALTRMGFKSGTWAGEAARTIGQYKSFPLGLAQKMYGRLNHGYNAEHWSVDGILNTQRMERLSYLSGMLALGAVSLTIKDLLYNREPLNPFNPDHWKLDNATRLVSQAGIPSIMLGEQFLNPGQLAGPAGSMAWNLVSSPFKESPIATQNAVLGLVPGSSIPLVKNMLRSTVSQLRGDAYEAAYQASLKRIELVTGQGPLIGK